jgi:hypothetical protein
MKRSRRRFLRLLAAGSAAALATPVARVGAGAAPARKPGRRPVAKPAPAARPAHAATPPAPLAEEIRKQKVSVEQALKAVRDYPLPPGSDLALTFRPRQARRREHTP